MQERKIKKIVRLYRVCQFMDKPLYSVKLNTFTLKGDIGPSSTCKIYRRQLKALSVNLSVPILLMDSEGGFCSGADSIIKSISEISPRICVVNVGECDSAAMDVYLACRWRYATKNSSFMIHNCLISIRDAFKNGKKMERKILNIVKAYDKSFYNKIYDREVLLNKEQLITLSKILQVNAPVFYSHIKNIIDREIKSLAFSDANSNESIVKNTKVSYEMLEEKTGKGQDWFITADEAVNLGICHGII